MSGLRTGTSRGGCTAPLISAAVAGEVEKSWVTGPPFILLSCCPPIAPKEGSEGDTVSMLSQQGRLWSLAPCRQTVAHMHGQHPERSMDDASLNTRGGETKWREI